MPAANPYKRTRRDMQRVRDLLDAEALPIWRIAQIMDMSETSLRNHFGDLIEAAELARGQKPHVPSPVQRKTVKMMSAIGVPKADIATHLSVTQGTLAENYAEELRMGRVEANTQVAGNLFKMATGPTEAKTSVIAAIWWSKAMMGWKDTSRIEQTGPNGGPIKHEQQILVVLPDNGRGDGPTPIPADSEVLCIEHDPGPAEDEETDA